MECRDASGIMLLEPANPMSLFGRRGNLVAAAKVRGSSICENVIARARYIYIYTLDTYILLASITSSQTPGSYEEGWQGLCGTKGTG